MNKKFRSFITLILIRLAKKTCIYGWTHDYLVRAEEQEQCMALHE